MIFLIFLISILFDVFCCYGLWVLTKKLQLWLRLIIVTLLVAVFLTPVNAVGEGGAGIFPVGLFFPFFLFSLFFGGHTDDSQRAGDIIWAALPVIWGVLYCISMLGLGIHKIVQKNTVIVLIVTFSIVAVVLIAALRLFVVK